MSFLENLNKIEEHLEKIKKVNRNVASVGKFSSLESDLVKEHLRALYELYDELPSFKISSNTVIDSKPNEKVEVEKKVEMIQQEVVVKKDEPSLIENKELENVTQEMDNEEAAEIIEESIEEVKEQPVEPVVSFEKESVNLFEKKQIQPEEIEVSSNNKTTKPIKQLIGLNDKFTFIKVLFGNSVAKYDEAIAKIDAMNSKKEAMHYFDTHVWNGKDLEEKEELVERIDAILEVKFGS
ncbi:MAG: hypothetical protein R2753_13625 [Chitinophagales bacterium]